MSFNDLNVRGYPNSFGQHYQRQDIIGKSPSRRHTSPLRSSPYDPTDVRKHYRQNNSHVDGFDNNSFAATASTVSSSGSSSSCASRNSGNSHIGHHRRSSSSGGFAPRESPGRFGENEKTFRSPSSTRQRRPSLTGLSGRGESCYEHQSPSIKNSPRALSYRTLSSNSMPSPSSMNRTRSSFSLLSKDIKEFQMKVEELEYSLDKGGIYDSSDEFKSRTLIDVCQELGNHIEQSFEKQALEIENLQRQQQGQLSSKISKARSAHFNLKCEYRNSYTKLKTLIMDFRSKDVMGGGGADGNGERRYGGGNSTGPSFLMGEKNGSHVPQDLQMKLVAQREEEYSVKVMQERESAIRDVNQKMHQVNEIYKDLGRIVQSQQENVDVVEENVNESNSNARGALEQLEKANKPSRFGNPFQNGRNPQGNEPEQNNTQVESSTVVKKGEDMDWSFKAFQSDMKDVKKDLVGMGSNVMTVGLTTFQSATSAMMRCSGGSMADLQYT